MIITGEISKVRNTTEYRVTKVRRISNGQSVLTPRP